MLEPFQLPFFQRGLAEILILAFGAGVIGTWIVLRGLAFYAHAVGTAAFPGLVLADGLGFSATLGAAGTGLLVAVGVGVLARREHAADRYDSLTALVLVGALATGVILASDVFGSGANVETLLFGSLLLVDGGDIALAAGASAAALLGARLLQTRWLVTGFDPGTARALGARSAVPDAVLLGLVALLAVAALTTLGALLATAVLVVPAATTRLFVDRLRRWQVATVVLVAVEGTVGLWLSVQLNAPPGPAIAVLAGGVFAVAALARALRPVLRRRRRRGGPLVAAALALLAFGAAGCATGDGGRTVTRADGTRALRVVATTTQLGDLVRQVGGPAVEVTQILRPNTDPHDYEPRPQDVLRTADAAVVFVSGDGLDHWMGDVVQQGGGDPAVVDLSRGLPHPLAGDGEGEDAAREDPHWWHDPRNVEVAVRRIRDALVAADPALTAPVDARAEDYLGQVRATDAAIARCLSAVPRAQRQLVTDHDAFGYFARRYGITVVGAVIPSQTTQAQPSAGDVSRLARLVRAQGVKAIFPEHSVNAKLAQAIARQSGARADLELYGDTLGPPDSAGGTYLGMERANADAMARGFTGRGCAGGTS